MSRKYNDQYFGLLPAELFLEIYSYLDRPALKAARGTSKLWILLIDSWDLCPIVGMLTDDNLPTLMNSDTILKTIHIKNFTDQADYVISRTRGIGRIMGKAETIRMSGPNIDHEGIGNIIKYSTTALREVSFESCCSKTLRAVLLNNHPLEFVRKLELSYKFFPIQGHTRILQCLGSGDSALRLPSLEHFKIAFNIVGYVKFYSGSRMPSTKLMFDNYLAISRLISTYRRTLKRVEILRSDSFLYVIQCERYTRYEPGVVLDDFRRNQIQQCLQDMEEVQLDVLHIGAFYFEGIFPWILETSLMQTQRRVQEASWLGQISKVSPNPFLLLNNLMSLTSVRLENCFTSTDPVDLGIFSECSNLETLELFLRRINHRYSIDFFTNLEKLPLSIKTLRLKERHLRFPGWISQQFVLTRSQIRWITENLRNLKSLWLLLVTEETDIDRREEQGSLENGQVVPEAPLGQVEEWNQMANFDLQTFRNVVAMPKLKEMRFDIIKASKWREEYQIGPRENLRFHHTSLDEVTEFVESIKPFVNTTKPSIDFTTCEWHPRGKTFYL